MNTKESVLVIGNGFDLYHFLPTRYIDFLKTVNRLIELEKEEKLTCCKYLKYLWGPDSPIYIQDEYIRECYRIHVKEMQSIELNQEKLHELVNIAKSNLWINYFQKCLEKNIGWIDFEKEIGHVLEAIQKLFLLDNITNVLVGGVLFDQMKAIDLKTMDILEHLPFVVKSDLAFELKEEYCKKGIGDCYYVSIDKEKILEQLEDDLEELAKALCIYLKELVQRIAISKSADNLIFYNIDKVLNFNYTDTYRRLYGEKVNVKFIHGSIDNDEKGIVLGINNDLKDELEDMDASLIKFKKYYQRAIKDTFYSIEDFLDGERTSYDVSIVGHSIDITDRDILEGLMNHPNTLITIYYHNEKAHGQQIVNLISLVGKKRFDELRNQKKVVFKLLKPFKEVASNMDYEYEEDNYSYEYSITRKYRILEESYGKTNTLLIGNALVKVSVRDDEVSVTEIKMVDHLLNLQEIYNHSGLYTGMVMIESLFNDNRYCGASVSISYMQGNEELTSIEVTEIKSLFETECEGIGISVSEVKIISAY